MTELYCFMAKQEKVNLQFRWYVGKKEQDESLRPLVTNKCKNDWQPISRNQISIYRHNNNSVMDSLGAVFEMGCEHTQHTA